MTTELDPGKIAKLLTQSSRQLDKGTLSALADARQNALKRQLVRTPAVALSTGRWTHNLIPHSRQQWLVTGLLVAIFVLIAGYWQHTQEQQISELDVAILTDELPIEVFVD
jgi:hypothetical protein